MTEPEGEQRVGITTQFIKKYHGVLNFYLPPELKERTDPVRVLSVACGFGLEALGIQRVMPFAYYEGIDLNPDLFLLARRLNSHLPTERFRQADAQNPDSFGQDPWDLVMLRNPQLGSMRVIHNRLWSKIIANSVNATKEGGFLFISSLTGLEFSHLLEYLGFFPQLRIENLPHEIPVSLPEIPLKDHFALLAKKLHRGT